ncbi:hypothetical protein EYF80_039520 [Liparis tanakae]|uniref:Uncharacterized protein n=1 Tax=Liparis tanakae TaxID=230148 RepID=A0A4Z2GB69_9TELE|nr:hypothetical protein EYF80_039520 [Liparis tanakae]
MAGWMGSNVEVAMSSGRVKIIWKKQRMALISMAWTPLMDFTKRAMMEKKTVDSRAEPAASDATRRRAQRPPPAAFRRALASPRFLSIVAVVVRQADPRGCAFILAALVVVVAAAVAAVLAMAVYVVEHDSDAVLQGQSPLARAVVTVGHGEMYRLSGSMPRDGRPLSPNKRTAGKHRYQLDASRNTRSSMETRENARGACIFSSWDGTNRPLSVSHW